MEIVNATGKIVEVQTAFPDVVLDPSSKVSEQHPLESIGEVGPIRQSRKRRRRQKKKRQAQASAVEAQTAFLDPANDLDQPQRLIPFSPSTEGTPDASPKVSSQQQLGSVGDVGPVRRTHRE